jgi:predicted nucleic acid-binding protein
VIRFFDTSAFVKRYVEEPGSAMVRATLREHPVTVARVAMAEAAAAIARAVRLGVIIKSR